MKKLVLLFVISLSLLMTVRANNLKLEGTVTPLSSTGSVLTMSVDLSWDNSWRDDYNWDAVWLFFKYKVGVDGAWQHATLNASGVTVTPSDYSAMSGTTSTTVPGIFIYPSKEWGANSGKLTVQVDWQTSTTKAQMENNDVFVVAHAVEMVYIPYGAYTIGDGTSANSFCDASGKPIIIDSEASVPLSCSTSPSSPVSPSASFPKGYQGFYIMKYETSQEQYVEFLNTLTLAQQTALIPGVDALKVGDFVFGANRTAPNYRNGVVLAAKQTGKPLKFDNNFNNNKQYSEDGDGGTLAMNYMSISDAQGYASWAGLRPLTEMEYEKACRRPFPQEPDAGEFAWNSNSGALSATGSPNGTSTETVTSGNVNASGSNLGGPVRCGIFARSSSPSQTASGATYWGVMEMSGNVSELCANITNTTISKTGNGMGAYNAALFGTAPTSYGTRGGGFSNIHTTLFTSDRCAVSCFTTLLQRDSTVGFRCAYTYGAVGTVNPGTLDAISSVCAGGSVTISGTPASAGTVKITGYIWSVNVSGAGFVAIPGEVGAMLAYSNFVAGKSYVFKRKAICPLGEAEVSTSSLKALTPVSISTQPTDQNATCGLTLKLTATGSATLTYQWMKDGDAVSGETAATYTKSPTTISDASFYHCVVTNSCGSVNSAIVQVTMDKVGKLGTMTDPRDGKTYQTRVMADGREWMIEDLKFGTCNASTFNLYWQSSVQNQIATGYYGVCIASIQPVGNFYNWQAAMNHSGANYNSSTNPSGNVEGNSKNQWQGICPDGWHLPSGGSTGEFQELYTALCSRADRIYPGTDDWRGVLGGAGGGTSVGNAGNYGFYWSSTYNDTYSAYNLLFNRTSVSMQTSNHKHNGFAVRCVKNY